MKRLFSLLAILFVATALFATSGAVLKAGGTFALVNMNTATDSTSNVFEESLNIKFNGLGFDVGVLADITDKFAVFSNFSMIFPNDATINNGEDSKKLSKAVEELQTALKVLDENASVGHKLNFFSISAGAAYKLDFKAVKLAIGVGFTLNATNLTVKGSVKIADEDCKLAVNQTYTNFGLSGLVDAKYMVTDRIGVGFSLFPQLGLYNITNASITAPDVIKEQIGQDFDTGNVDGFKISFAMPIVIGVSYSF